MAALNSELKITKKIVYFQVIILFLDVNFKR